MFNAQLSEFRLLQVEDDDEDADVVDVLDASADLDEEALSLEDRDAIADRVPVRVEVADAVGKAPATAR